MILMELLSFIPQAVLVVFEDGRKLSNQFVKWDVLFSVLSYVPSRENALAIFQIVGAEFDAYGDAADFPVEDLLAH